MNIEFQQVDDAMLEGLENKQEFIDAEIKKFDEKIKYAEEVHGDTEVRDVIIEKAEFYTKVKQNVNAKETFLKALDKTIGVSKRLEVIMFILQIAFLDADVPEMKKYIDKSLKLLEEGGDWERKNKLKVYEGVYFIMVREFKNAANKLLDCMSTFQSPEIISFQKLIWYAVVTSMMTLERKDIKENVLRNSEVLSVIREDKNLHEFLNSFYTCDYAQFFKSLLEVFKNVECDRLMSTHKKFVLKELRIMIYSQFLESYKSVTLGCMAEAFGVSEEFLDRELSGFISMRRLHCKIDKVNNLIELEKIDQRNFQYKKALAEGQVILERIQKLSRVIDV